MRPRRRTNQRLRQACGEAIPQGVTDPIIHASQTLTITSLATTAAKRIKSAILTTTRKVHPALDWRTTAPSSSLLFSTIIRWVVIGEYSDMTHIHTSKGQNYTIITIDVIKTYLHSGFKNKNEQTKNLTNNEEQEGNFLDCYLSQSKSQWSYMKIRCKSVPTDVSNI